MPKKTNVKSKTRKARAQRPPRPPPVPQSRRVSAVPRVVGKRMGHAPAVCSITDPFCIHARGAQRPDGGPPSVPFQIRSLVQCTALLTAGCCRYTFVPNVLFGYINANLVSTTYTNVANWLDVGGTAFVTSNAKEVRITSFGCVVRSALSATSAKGLCITSTDPAPVVSGSYTQGSMAANESCINTVASGMEVTWVSKPLGPTAHHFKPISNYTNTMSDFDWSSLTVEIASSDATSNVVLVTVEYVMNIEFTCSSGASSSIAQLQKTPPPPNRVATAAASHAQSTASSFIQGGISEATSFLETKAKSALDTILADGMALLFG